MPLHKISVGSEHVQGSRLDMVWKHSGTELQMCLRYFISPVFMSMVSTLRSKTSIFARVMQLTCLYIIVSFFIASNRRK